jgi:prophage tail gpP-like protein
LPFEIVALIVKGQAFRPVTIAIRRAMDEAASTFEAKVKAQRYSQPELLRLFAGSPACVIRSSASDGIGLDAAPADGGDLMLTGHVEKRSPRLGQVEKELRIAGRSKTADAVDSANDHETGELRGKTPLAMAKEVTKPFGIDVEADAPGELRKVSRLRPGETPQKFIERLARVEGVTLTDTAEGKLKLAGAPKQRHAGAIADGDGWPVILDASAEHDDSKKFSEIRVRAQAPEGFGPAELEIDERASDPSMTRKRIRVVTPPEEVSKQQARKRAQWHRDRAAGAGTSAQVTVKGWRDAAGKLWQPGWLIPVHVADLDLAQEMMIESVSYEQSDADAGDGTKTTLNLVDPRTYGGKGGKGGKSGAGWNADKIGGDDV